MKTPLNFLAPLALLAAVALTPVLGITACSSDATNSSPSPGASGTNDAGPSPSTSTAPGSGAGSTLSVRVANLYGPQSIPGPTVDFVSNDLTDTGKYKVVLSSVAYGTLTAPLTLAHLDGASNIYVYPTGTYTPGNSVPEGWATAVVLPDGTPAESAVAILPDGHFQRGQQSNLTVAAGKGAINFQEGNIPSPTPLLGYIIDGACVDRNSSGEPFANLDAGSHTVRFIDLEPHQCDPATSTDLHPQTTVTIVAGQVVEIIAPGTTATDPVLVVPDWK